MWSVNEVTVRHETLDFTSSGQGHYKAMQILLDGALFANAAGLTSWNGGSSQVVVCTACGAEHCEHGGWLTLRSVGDLRAFVPMFDEWTTEKYRHEYAPPPLIEQRGAPLFEPSVYARLRAVVPDVPSTPPPLRGHEARELVMFEAPRGLRLGGNRDNLKPRVVAAEGAEVDEVVGGLLALLAQLASTAHLVSRQLAAGDRPVKLYVNDAVFTEWTPYAITKRGPRLLCGQWVLEHGTASREGTGPVSNADGDLGDAREVDA